MGSVSLLEDEEDRRDDALHFGRLGSVENYKRRQLSKALIETTHSDCNQPARYTSIYSKEQMEEMRQRAIKREKIKLAWRKEQSLIRLEELNVILDLETRNATPIRRDRPMLWPLISK